MAKSSALIYYLRANYYSFQKLLSTGTMLIKEPLPLQERNLGTNDLIASICILHKQQDANVNIKTWFHNLGVSSLSWIMKCHFLNSLMPKEQERNCTGRAEESRSGFGKLQPEDWPHFCKSSCNNTQPRSPITHCLRCSDATVTELGSWDRCCMLNKLQTSTLCFFTGKLQIPGLDKWSAEPSVG